MNSSNVFFSDDLCIFVSYRTLWVIVLKNSSTLLRWQTTQATRRYTKRVRKDIII